MKEKRFAMNKLVAVLAAGLALGPGAVVRAGAPSRSLVVGDVPPPAIPLVLGTGQRTTLGALRGNLVLVDFFITG